MSWKNIVKETMQTANTLNSKNMKHYTVQWQKCSFKKKLYNSKFIEAIMYEYALSILLQLH